MLSKEEISEVISYCQEHGCSYKDRLTELGIAEWKFYDSKYRYAIQERKIKESGQFLQLKPSSDGSFVPFPSLDSPAGSLEWRELVLIVEGIMENPDGRRQLI